MMAVKIMPTTTKITIRRNCSERIKAKRPRPKRDSPDSGAPSASFFPLDGAVLLLSDAEVLSGAVVLSGAD